MAQRLTLSMVVADDLADRAEYLLRAIAREAHKARSTVTREPVTPEEQADEVARVMFADPFGHTR